MSSTVKEYKSPTRKLLSFFERSRDGWKEKCAEAKAKVKRLRNRTEQLAESRERWKGRAEELRQEVERLRRELEAQKT
jgi:predicted  nucleic acid-binding Zn-ribbon protein